MLSEAEAESKGDEFDMVAVLTDVHVAPQEEHLEVRHWQDVQPQSDVVIESCLVVKQDRCVLGEIEFGVYARLRQPGPSAADEQVRSEVSGGSTLSDGDIRTDNQHVHAAAFEHNPGAKYLISIERHNVQFESADYLADVAEGIADAGEQMVAGVVVEAEALGGSGNGSSSGEIDIDSLGNLLCREAGGKREKSQRDQPRIFHNQ